MKRKDFVTKFLEVASIRSIDETPCCMVLYKYPSGRFCISLESYHTNQTFVRVQGTNLARMLSAVLKEHERLVHRSQRNDILLDKENLLRPTTYILTPEEIGIVTTGLREKRKAVKK